MADMTKGGQAARQGAVVQNCSCAHTEQDRMYGRNMRVMNRCNGGVRCTVCLTKHPALQ